MIVKLKFHTPLSIVVDALNMSHDTHGKSDIYDKPTDDITDKDTERLSRVINKLKHKSIAEMAVYHFDIDGISRACLQELARHRTARLTVKSTRYTLNKMKPNDNFMDYLVSIDQEINNLNFNQLKAIAESKESNDIKNYMLPEAFKTRLLWQIDGRNLQNFLTLRCSKEALWEIRELAKEIFDNLPDHHKYIYKGCVDEIYW